MDVEQPAFRSRQTDKLCGVERFDVVAFAHPADCGRVHKKLADKPILRPNETDWKSGRSVWPAIRVVGPLDEHLMIGPIEPRTMVQHPVGNGRVRKMSRVPYAVHLVNHQQDDM